MCVVNQNHIYHIQEKSNLKLSLIRDWHHLSWGFTHCTQTSDTESYRSTDSHIMSKPQVRSSDQKFHTRDLVVIVLVNLWTIFTFNSGMGSGWPILWPPPRVVMYKIRGPLKLYTSSNSWKVGLLGVSEEFGSFRSIIYF